MKQSPGLKRRVPLMRAVPLDRGTTGLSRGVPLKRAPRERKARKDTGAPQAVKDAVFDRDRWCLRCGKAPVKREGGYSIHHLTFRSHGVDNSVEAQILLCGSGTTGCHGWVHAHPAKARAAGWIRSGNASTDPGEQPVMVALSSGRFGWFVLLPDGTRRGVPDPEEVAA